jgi:hypothetical protein
VKRDHEDDKWNEMAKSEKQEENEEVYSIFSMVVA